MSINHKKINWDASWTLIALKSFLPSVLQSLGPLDLRHVDLSLLFSITWLSRLVGSHWLGLTAKCSQNPSNPGVKRRRLVWRVLLVVAPIPHWICWSGAGLILSEVSEGIDSITLPPVTDSDWLCLDESSAPLYNSSLQSKYRNYNINNSQNHSLPDLPVFPSDSVQCFLRPWYSL